MSNSDFLEVPFGPDVMAWHNPPRTELAGNCVLLRSAEKYERMIATLRLYRLVIRQGDLYYVTYTLDPHSEINEARPPRDP